MAAENPGPRAIGAGAGINTEHQHVLDTRPRARSQGWRLRRQWQVERIHRLGARAVAELLDEIGRHNPEIVADLDRRIAAYAAIDAEILGAVGGDRFPASPMRVVGGDR